MIAFPLAISQIVNDSDRAFMENLYLSYRRLMYRVALNYVKSITEADDVINTACERLCKKICTIRRLQSNALTAYIVSTMRNCALNYISAENRHTSNRDFSADEAIEKSSRSNDAVEDFVLHRIFIEDIRDAIGRLPRREYEVMRMKFCDDLPNNEIAEVLGITDNNVRGIVKRARDHIIKDLIDKKRIDVNEIPS